ncbi:MAG: carbon-phosphorus lyase complex subunit PhnJ [Sphaerobacteraceae bacterium]|nr:MAG: carbon-phosphorus lyase complex subunit PhnJ [Sphaerobacteraceae bacterium]
MTSVRQLVQDAGVSASAYSYGFLDETAKREIRRKTLKAIAIPGYQVPFGSREMPVSRGWGTGGMQLTLSLVGPDDVVKVIDQGDDAGVNAANIRRLVERTTGLSTTLETAMASIIQSRHRIPEEALRSDQILVLQVPVPEPLRNVERRVSAARVMHAERDYSKMWLALYEDIVRRGEVSFGAGYPVMVHGRYIMAPSPIPRWDIPLLNQSDALYLFGAGREKRIYAVPPHTSVEPLQFDDYPFAVEDFDGKSCARCGANDTFLEESISEVGMPRFRCSDTAHCDKVLESREVGT